MKKSAIKKTDIQSKARALNINPMPPNRHDLIQAIQKAEGNTPCFGSDTPACPQTDCCWREICIK